MHSLEMIKALNEIAYKKEMAERARRAQVTVEYYYDSNGNRCSKQVYI